MKRLITWALGFFVIFAFSITIIQALWHSDGSNSVFASALSPDPTCPQPCWRGIQLGQTTTDEAHSVLTANPLIFTDIKRTTANADFITWQFIAVPEMKGSLIHLPGRAGNDVQAIRFDLYNTRWNIGEKFTLADAIQLWGAPISSSIYYCSYGDANRALVTIHFVGNVYVTTSEIFNDWGGNPVPDLVHITPHLPIVFVEYYADSNTMTSRPSGIWKGFKDRREDSLKFTNFC